MIASVVATLDQNATMRSQLLAEVAARPELDSGEIAPNATRIPITIDVQNRHKMEECTAWLRTQPGVVMVDVVFVHFEEDSPQT